MENYEEPEKQATVSLEIFRGTSIERCFPGRKIIHSKKPDPRSLIYPISDAFSIRKT